MQRRFSDDYRLTNLGVSSLYEVTSTSISLFRTLPRLTDLCLYGCSGLDDDWCSLFVQHAPATLRRLTLADIPTITVVGIDALSQLSQITHLALRAMIADIAMPYIHKGF